MAISRFITKRLLLSHLIVAGLAASAVLVGPRLFVPRTLHTVLPSFEQPYLKRGELSIRPSGDSAVEVLLLITADKPTYFKWRNWKPSESSATATGQLIFPEKFLIALYDNDQFNIGTLQVPSAALEHREDINDSTILLGATVTHPIAFSLARQVRSYRVSFEYVVK